MQNYIEVRPEAGKEFFMKYAGKGKVVMLNLLKFRAVADYSDFTHIAPNEPLSGKEAYKLYMENTWPFLEKAGGRVLYYGKSESFLIGPEAVKWDAILLVEHASAEAFVGFAQNQDYLKIAGHRNAALEDSRLLPSSSQGV